MGLVERVKKKLRGSGHVQIDLDVPPRFRWNQGELPITISFAGAESRDRVVETIEFRLGTRIDGKRSGSWEDDDFHRFPVVYRHRLAIPMGQLTLHRVSIPLSVEAVREQTVVDPRYPRWLQTTNITSAEDAFGRTGDALLHATVFYEHDRFPSVVRARTVAD